MTSIEAIAGSRWCLNCMIELSPCVVLGSDLLEILHPASHGQWTYNVQQFV